MATATTSNESRTIHFGIFDIDLKAGELRRNGNRVRLQEQPFQILTCLLERPGEVVTREEMRTKLWPADTFVDFDHSLNAAIRRLRDALGDSAESPRFVETVARRGYRFIAPVHGAPPLSPPQILSAATGVRWWHWTVLAACVLAVGVVIGWRAGQRSTSGAVRERRLTANPAEAPVQGGAISPDGRYLAFADHTGFYLRQIATGETHPVPLPAGFDAVPASWFPDGVHLVVTSVSGPQEAPAVWAVSVLGGTPRKLTDRGVRPAVSPDGSRIVFLSGTETPDQIWLMQADGGNPRRLLGGNRDIFGPPVWAPDGKSIAYVRGKYQPGTFGFQGQIEIYELESGRNHVVLANPLLNAALCWTADGRLIYALAETPPNQNDSNLWAQSIDFSSGTPKGPATRLTRASGVANSISITADSKRLAYFRNSMEPDVYVAEVAAGGDKLSQPKRLTLDENADYPYSWTPDSKAVLFISDRNGTQDIFRQAPEQATPELLFGGTEQHMIPRLSPNGESILYLVPPKVGSSSNTVRLMRAPLTGGPPQLVLEGPGINNQQCAKFPASLCLLSELEPGRERFFAFDPVKGLGKEIQKAAVGGDDYYAFNWSLSPEGRTLALAKKLATQKAPAIWLFSMDDGTERPLSLPGWAGINSVDWSADGKSLWVQAHAAKKQALLNIDLHGRARTMLEEDTLYLGWAIPSPDGKRLAIWEASGSSNAWMLENF